MGGRYPCEERPLPTWMGLVTPFEVKVQFSEIEVVDSPLIHIGSATSGTNVGKKIREKNERILIAIR